MTPRRVLIIQLARMGDLVQTWPLLRQLRRAHPRAHLGLLVDEPWRELATLSPYVDEIQTLDLKKLGRLTSRHPDKAYKNLNHLVKDLQGRHFELVYNLNFSRVSLLLTHLLEAPVRGYRPVAGGRETWREPWLAYIYGLVHARIFNRVHVSEVFRHLAPPAAVEEISLAPPRPLSREPIIALQAGTRHPKRTWPLISFAELAGRLMETLGAKIWLMGTAAERGLGERLMRRLAPPYRERVADLQGRTSLKELAERLQEADLVISGDTGTLHLAAAMGTPVVGIFLGPARCFETGPYGAGHWIIQAEPPCHPCMEAGVACSEPVCQTLIRPELVGEVAVAACSREEFRGADIPEVRIYRSGMEPFGVKYEIYAGKPLGWADLLGQAYRVAGAHLLGHAGQPMAVPTPGLSIADAQFLKRLAGALRNGRLSDEPAVQRALTPLQAFQKTLERQTSWKTLQPPVPIMVQKMRAALRTELERYVQ